MTFSGSSLPDWDFAVNPCDSALKEFKTKNPVITDRKERHKNGDPAGIRTLDHRLKRAMLYRLSYQVTSVLLQNIKKYITVS